MAEQESPTETATMMSSPSPWVATRAVRDGEKKDWWDITVARGEPGGYQYQQHLAMVFYADGHDEANAAAMAAAPDLLAALKTARRVLEIACGTKAPYICRAFEVIDTAIAKAVPR